MAAHSAQRRKRRGGVKRARERGQLALDLSARKGWGGKRKGAGRPRKDPTRLPEVAHTARPALAARHPVHVVVRTVEAVRGLRRRACYHAIRGAVLRCALRSDFRVVHLSIQQSHVHLIVEAADKSALARGMQAFQISAARGLNRAIGGARGPRRGVVFPSRYHATVLRSPTQTRHAMAYVLNNWRKHWAQIPATQRALWIDPFSSAYTFPGWAEYGDAVFLWPMPPTYEPLLVCRPHTWLLREGYLRGGPPISLADVPRNAP